MRKKIISVILAAVMAVSALALAASAAEIDTAEASGTTGTIKFEDPWDSGSIYFHIWDASNPDENTKFATKNGWASNAWGSKKIKGTKVDGEENVWQSFEFEIPEGHDVFVIFANENGMQTYDCIINANCFGDKAYTTGETVENPVDSEKTAIVAEFENNADCGPYRQITSTGHVVGNCSAPSDDAAKIVADYIWNLNGQKDKTGEDCVTTDKVQNALTQFGTDADSVWTKYQELHSGDEGYADKEAAAKEVLGVVDNTDDDTSSTVSSETSSVTSSTVSSETSSITSSTTSNNENPSKTSSTVSEKKNTPANASSKSTSTTKTTASSTTGTVATGVVTAVVFALVILTVSGAMVLAARKREEQ